MARADDIMLLMGFILQRNWDGAIEQCNCIAKNEPANSSLRARIERKLASLPSRIVEGAHSGLKGLVIAPGCHVTIDDLTLSDEVAGTIGTFLQEFRAGDLIREAGLVSPHKLLLSGPPGNGKTSLAGAIAESLAMPLYVVDLSSVISSLMGETSSKLAKIFREAVTAPCVLFFDELETVLSERSESSKTNDVGEIKRVVSSLLLEIDRLPPWVILIGATNHPELLDRAVTRRFDYKVELPLPTNVTIQKWINHFAEKHPSIPVADITRDSNFDNFSFSAVETEVNRLCRQWIMRERVPAAKSA